MNAVGYSSFDSLDLDSADSTMADELEFVEESVEQLLERANRLINQVETTIAMPLNPPTTPTQNVITVLAHSPPTPIATHAFRNVTDDDDDVIFVGEQRGTIDLCSPEPSSRFNLRFNGNQQVNRALPPTEKSCTATAPTTPDNSDAGPAKNSVFCAVCLNSSVGRNPHSTKCGHIFCGPCLTQTVRLHKKCPMCNTVLNSLKKDVHPVFL